MLKLFSGSCHPRLAEEVSKILKVPISKSEVVRFENSEARVRIEEEVKDAVCAVIQPTSSPTDSNIIELLLFCDALRRSEAKEVVAVIPYFGYARQNIQHRRGEAVSAHVVVKMLESVGFSEVATFDIHDEGIGGIFSIPFNHLTSLSLLASKIRQDMKNEEIQIVSPDQGGIERTRKFAESFFGNKKFDIAIIEKKRELDKIHKSKVLDLYGNVKDKTVILVDDVITSGGTIIKAAELCLGKGAKKVVAAVTHHDFSKKAPAKLQASKIEKFYMTNTIPLKKEQKFKKLVEYSIASEIAKIWRK